ncbi:MAG: PilW family protein [Proteobacteria bacterium]|nr:PilW family protein [Pseudomonadota bacterium]
MVELLVAMLLGLFLLTALVEILLSGKQSFTAASHLSRLQENGRIATSMIVTDLKRAGYMGGNSDIPNIFGSAGQAAAAISCATGDTSWGRMVTQRIVGLDDTNAGYACIPNSSYLRGDVLTIRHASPWPSGAFGANQLHLRSSLFEGKIFAGVDQALAANLVLDQPQSVRDLIAHAYSVGNSGRSCSGQAVPSLFRVRLGNNSQPLIEELLPGIEHFQVQYGVGGQYLDADAVADWNQVVTARFWLLVRSECPETGFADARTYTLGDQVYTPNDSFRRQLYSSVVMLRN